MEPRKGGGIWLGRGRGFLMNRYRREVFRLPSALDDYKEQFSRHTSKLSNVPGSLMLGHVARNTFLRLGLKD
jgi:hypothetical protein